MTNAVHNSIIRCLIEESERRGFVHLSINDCGNDEWWASITGDASAITDPIGHMEKLETRGITATQAINNLEIFLQRWY